MPEREIKQMKKIIITNEATLSAEGKLSNRKCKPVVCIDTGEVYTSVTDAAERNGVDASSMSWACAGKTKLCKGKRFCFVSDMVEHYEEIARHIREMYPAYMENKKQEQIDKARENYAQRCAKYDKARDGVEKAREELIALGVTEL